MRAVRRMRGRRLQRRDFVWQSFILNPLGRTSVRLFPQFIPPWYFSHCSPARSADGEVDAAEIDKELISARLKQDVLEHAGKLHIFVADSVSTFRSL